MITAKASGKLFIAGEYAVTNPGHLAIVTNVPKYLTVTLEPSDYNEIYSDFMPNSFVEWERECGVVVPLGENPFPIVTKTIETVEWYVSDLGYELQNFELNISSGLDEGGVKYGLGSSAAVSVATIKAMLDLYTINHTPLLVYKLASIVQLRLNSNGSFGDIAASSFDTLIAYSCFDKEWLLEQLTTYSLSDVTAMTWKKLMIEPLTLPKNTAFLVGWTGNPSSTEQLVADIKHTHENTEKWSLFLQQSQDCVMRLMVAIKSNDINGIKQALYDNRLLLQALSPHIETPLLERLITSANEHSASAKTSGAGGGDCGIAFIDNSVAVSDLVNTWQTANITLLLSIGGNYNNEQFTFYS